MADRFAVLTVIKASCFFRCRNADICEKANHFDNNESAGHAIGRNSADTCQVRNEHFGIAIEETVAGGSIYNLMYTHTEGPWTFNPYLQYTYVQKDTTLSIAHAASTYGAALLVKYAFDPNFSVSGRAEYIDSTGSVANSAPSLLYGAGSSAWSLTVTPTYQKGMFFGRAEASYTRAMDITAGSAFGKAGTDKTQTRGVLEVGVLF